MTSTFGRGRVRLSQCMIVKNEERNIERALSWGRDIMFEQIVVDTGSTDRTVELAEQMGAKVFHYEWIDDFASAKNFAIDQAKGNWIAFLDADEYFLPEAVDKIIPILEDLHPAKPLAVITEWLNFDDGGKFFCGGTQIRLFRNLAGLRYHNSIHEVLRYHNRSFRSYELVDANEELSIHHEGYMKSVNGEGQKGRRNRPLIEKELERDPNNSDLMGYLADCYWNEKKPDIALEWYEKSIAAMDSEILEYSIRASTTFANLMNILATRNEEKRLMEVYHIAVKKVPKEADFDFYVGRYFIEVKEYGKAVYHLERALELLSRFGDNCLAAHLTGNLPGTWEILALCYFNNGELDKCVKYCVNLLKAQNFIMSTLTMLLMAFKMNQEQPASVLQFLTTLYDFNVLKDLIFVLKASMKVNYDELTVLLRNKLTQEQRESFDRALPAN